MNTSEFTSCLKARASLCGRHCALLVLELRLSAAWRFPDGLLCLHGECPLLWLNTLCDCAGVPPYLGCLSLSMSVHAQTTTLTLWSACASPPCSPRHSHGQVTHAAGKFLVDGVCELMSVCVCVICLPVVAKADALAGMA